MIIYGGKNSTPEEQIVKNSTCPNCEGKDSMVVFAYAKYAHIYWIPLFSLGKYGAAVCGNCEHEIKPRKMSESLKLAYQNLKKQVRIPIWHFAGLFIIGGLVAYASYASGENAKKEETYFANPKFGDIYSYKIDDENYSTLRIEEVGQDSIYFTQNDYVSETAFGIYKIDKRENYTSIKTALSKEEIKQMYEDEIIYDIDRK